MANMIPLDDTTLAHDHRLRGSLFLAGLVVLCYDHVLTLESEVKHIWSQKIKRSSAWFLLVRYVALVSNIALAPYFLGDFSAKTCKKLSVAENALLVFQETLIEATLAVRVCAMYGFNRRVFAALAVVAVITVSLGAWAAVGSDSALTVPVPGCYVTTPRAQVIRTTAAWEFVLVCDILILGLTLRRAYTYHRAVGLRSQSLIGSMVRDGAVYFAMMCLINMANILMLYYGDIITAGSLAWVASAISVTILSRLMLNLHTAVNRDWTTPTYQDREMRYPNTILDDRRDVNGD